MLVLISIPASLNPFRKVMAGPCPQGPASPSYVGTDTGASVPTPPLPLSRPCGSVRIPRQGKPNNLLSIMELLSDIVYWALYAFFFGGCILILGAQIIRDTIELAKDFHDVNRKETDEEEQV